MPVQTTRLDGVKADTFSDISVTEYRYSKDRCAIYAALDVKDGGHIHLELSLTEAAELLVKLQEVLLLRLVD